VTSALSRLDEPEAAGCLLVGTNSLDDRRPFDVMRFGRAEEPLTTLPAKGANSPA